MDRKNIWNSATIEAFTDKTITTFEDFEAHLATCRSKGYTEGNNELEVGLRSIALPIFNRKGETIAAMNISTNMMKSSEKQIAETLLPVLLEGVKKLNQRLDISASNRFSSDLKSHTSNAKLKRIQQLTAGFSC